MATIKSFTDLEQSKQLAEILPLESADCFWDYDEMQKFHRISWFEDGYNKNSQLSFNKNNVCAWSLAALLNVLPYPILCKKSDNTWGVDLWVDNKFYCTYASYKIDACYEMIIKLHELNLL